VPVAVAAALDPLREALISLEPGLAPLLVVTAVASALLARLVRVRGRPRDTRVLRVVERGLGRALGRWGWALSVLLWLIPLWSARAGRPPDLLAAWQMPFGEIPWSDGYGYFEGAHQLLANGRFGGFAEQKPMYPALLSVVLWLARGSLDRALTVMGVILGLASFLAAREIGLRHGLWCALGAFGMLLGLGRGVAPTVVTEPLGMAFGALALAVLISSKAARRPPWFAAGLFLLTLAMQVRPGAQFVLLFLALWMPWHFRAQRARALGWAAAAIVAGMLLTSVLGRVYGAGESSFYARPAFFVYGLVQGTNEGQAYDDFASRRGEFPNESRFARFVFAEALSEFRKHPATLFASCASGAGRVVEKNAKTLAGIVNLTRIPNAFRDGPGRREVAWPGALLLAVLFALSVARMGRSGERAFWLAVAAGTVASGAFVGNDNPVHGMATVHPLMALGLSLGLGARRTSRRLWPARAVAFERRTVRAALALGAALALLALIGPDVARDSWPRPPVAMMVGMQPGHDLLIAAEATPAIAVGPGGLSFSRYRVLLELSGSQMDVVHASPPFAVLSAWDFVSRRQLVVYAPAEVARSAGFVHLAIEEEQRAPNHQPVVRAGSWEVLGPWK
jgi:hypothetical protein